MSHGNRRRSVSSKLSLSTMFVCERTSFSTNFWSNLFLLWEWIHPSIQQQCSHADAEHMTQETLYVNQAISLSGGSPVHLSVTPSRKNVTIQVAWGSLSISVVKAPWTSSLTSSSKWYCTPNVVCHDWVRMCTKNVCQYVCVSMCEKIVDYGVLVSTVCSYTSLLSSSHFIVS